MTNRTGARISSFAGGNTITAHRKERRFFIAENIVRAGIVGEKNSCCASGKPMTPPRIGDPDGRTVRASEMTNRPGAAIPSFENGIAITARITDARVVRSYFGREGDFKYHRRTKVRKC